MAGGASHPWKHVQASPRVPPEEIWDLWRRDRDAVVGGGWGVKTVGGVHPHCPGDAHGGHALQTLQGLPTAS